MQKSLCILAILSLSLAQPTIKIYGETQYYIPEIPKIYSVTHSDIYPEKVHDTVPHISEAQFSQAPPILPPADDIMRRAINVPQASQRLDVSIAKFSTEFNPALAKRRIFPNRPISSSKPELSFQ
jgi:hypothetical protein